MIPPRAAGRGDAPGGQMKPSPSGAERHDPKGYVWIKVIDHPEFKTGWVRKHHLVYFEQTGQRVPRNCVLHHIDNNKSNNHIDNLELLTTYEHSSMHIKQREPWNKGQTDCYSEQHKNKLREANRNRVWSDGSKQKISNYARSRTDVGRDQEGRYTPRRDK